MGGREWPRAPAGAHTPVSLPPCSPATLLWFIVNATLGERWPSWAWGGHAGPPWQARGCLPLAAVPCPLPASAAAAAPRLPSKPSCPTSTPCPPRHLQHLPLWRAQHLPRPQPPLHVLLLERRRHGRLEEPGQHHAVRDGRRGALRRHGCVHAGAVLGGGSASRSLGRSGWLSCCGTAVAATIPIIPGRVGARTACITRLRCAALSLCVPRHTLLCRPLQRSLHPHLLPFRGLPLPHPHLPGSDCHDCAEVRQGREWTRGGAAWWVLSRRGRWRPSLLPSRLLNPLTKCPPHEHLGACRGGLHPPHCRLLPHRCSPATAAAAYWESVPNPVLWPVVVLATAATIIASQALISGAFSIVQQVRVMCALPRRCIAGVKGNVRG